VKAGDIILTVSCGGHCFVPTVTDMSPLENSEGNDIIWIPRPGFDSRHYQKKNAVGLERGPLSLVSTTEELLDTKVAAPV
jgi:hypothetical protein